MSRHSALVVLLAVFAAATSCTNSPSIDREAIADATVRVQADGCGPRSRLGVGTAIGDGLVVTAAHVVAGADHVVIDHVDTTIDAEVVLFDPDLDVAALRPVAATGAAAPLRDDPASEGETGVIAITSADGPIELVEVEVLQRVTILTTDIYRDEQVRRPGVRLAVAVEPGDSGAMVHLAGGGVGIVWSRSTERSEQAWTVDLPEELLRSDARRTITTPVDTGPCPST